MVLMEHSPSSLLRLLFLLLASLLRHPARSLLLVRWLLANPDARSFPLDAAFFNVALKSLRAARRWDLAEPLAADMLAAGVPPDNITYSTLISAARRCRRLDRSVHWFERMYAAGVVPDEVTYSAALDAYARLGRRHQVAALYDRARAAGWRPDAVAFAVLARMYGEAADYDGIHYVLSEMRALGVAPNAVVYNTLLQALGKAGRPALARSLFDEMLRSGLSPNEKTLTAMIKIYGKARWGRDALELWERMKANKWPMDFILYNTLLSMCADLGLEDEAEKLFDEMKRSEGGRAQPDSWSYSAMINIYGCGGKAERALEVFEEMLGRKVEPNIMCYTCLIQCLGKAGRVGDAVRVFETAIERGTKPDDRLCGCLLSIVALSREEEVGMVLSCLEKANPRLVEFVKLLKKEEASFDEIKEEFRGIMNEAETEVRRPYCNCLIDICRNQSFPPQRAKELFQIGMTYGLYGSLHTKGSSEWSLNLKSLSVGAAKTAFEEWMMSLLSEQEEGLPESFCVFTGAGNHKFSHGLGSAFRSHLEKLGAPFLKSEERSGSFVASKEEVVSWLRLGILSQMSLHR
ncbi:pentatricopeptide repeat-containing protein At5g46580, chloroplastic [Ananas comosus]|uniref:Pentatricopeptide repeat-containing protein At5g46580, chloroplastic n=1 Tax=Ananas comosus TaxID=4615 RepID=A0A6P5FIY6_ANACO|nr:pentatricopeptide repeat-containing protein At5g46580, chloroplastic [Ananas comosus]